VPRLSRSTVALLLVLALLSGLDGWLRLAERSGCSAPPALSRLLLREALERQTAVRADVAAALERRRRVEELARAVAQGRLTLREGAARLREVYRVPGFPWQAVERRFPGASEEECCCRLLIGEVRSLEGLDREQARAAAPRLEAELESALRGGALSPQGQAAPSVDAA
jgi:hypothetical protein